MAYFPVVGSHVKPNLFNREVGTNQAASRRLLNLLSSSMEVKGIKKIGCCLQHLGGPWAEYVSLKCLKNRDIIFQNWYDDRKNTSGCEIGILELCRAHIEALYAIAYFLSDVHNRKPSDLEATALYKDNMCISKSTD